MRVLVAPVVVALLIGVIAVTVFNPIVTGASKRYETLRAMYRSGEESSFSISEEGLWLRQSTTNGQAVIHATSANADGSEFYEVTFIMLDENGMPSERVQAAIARIGIGSWNLEYVKVWSFAKLNNPEAGSRRYRSMHIPTSLTHERIMETIGGSSLISFWDMRRHIAQLESAGFSTRRALVWLQVELARPLFLATMVVIGAAFTMGSIRSGRTGLMVVFAIAFGFVLYFLQSFAVILGEIGQVPASLAAWASPLAGLLLAIGLILHLEDG